MYDCFEFDGEDNDDRDDLSEEEESARLRMLVLCRKITEAHEDEMEEYDSGK